MNVIKHWHPQAICTILVVLCLEKPKKKERINHCDLSYSLFWVSIGQHHRTCCGNDHSVRQDKKIGHTIPFCQDVPDTEQVRLGLAFVQRFSHVDDASSVSGFSALLKDTSTCPEELGIKPPIYRLEADCCTYWAAVDIHYDVAYYGIKLETILH